MDEEYKDSHTGCKDNERECREIFSLFKMKLLSK